MQIGLTLDLPVYFGILCKTITRMMRKTKLSQYGGVSYEVEILTAKGTWNKLIVLPSRGLRFLL